MQPLYESSGDGCLGDGILTTLDNPYGNCGKYPKGRYGLLQRCFDIRLIYSQVPDERARRLGFSLSL
ncbi:hypothetical protein PIB30_102204, partial [Stylosanthes scabra]|nr:hypothetical protein [Stylosanthes scabra]